MSINNESMPGILTQTRQTNYGSFNPSNAPSTLTHSSLHSSHSHSSSHSPRATITSVLDIKPNPHKSSIHSPSDTDSIHSTVSSTSSEHHTNIIPPLPPPNLSKPSIKVLQPNEHSLLYPASGTKSKSMSNIITYKENDTYYKQHHHKKSGTASFIKSSSSIMLPSLSADMSHHIEHHLLRPCMYGTPHHNEAHQEHLGDSPIRRVIFNMLNSIIGAGVVGLPYVYKTSGLIGGLVLMVFFAFISAYSLKLLVIAAKLCYQRNYEDLCEYLFGYKGYIFVSITMLIFDFGATLSYLIILGDSASDIIAIWGYDSTSDRQLIITIVSIFIILPTILPRDISKIEKVSTLSVLSVILIMLVVIYEWIAYRFLMLQFHDGYQTHLPSNINWGIELDGFPMAIGIIAFAFVCHDSSFLLYNTLKNPTVPRWSILAYSGCFTAVFICACFAVPGYLTFGDKVNDNILTNYETFNPLIIAARCIYCITMALTYPCSFFVVRHVCYALFHHGPEYESITKAPLYKHLLFTIPLFGLNVLMGIFIENLGIVMSVSGSLSAVVLAFVLPPACYLKICQYKVCFWREKGYHRKWRALRTTGPPALLFAFGVFVAIFSTSFTIAQHYGLKFD